ncbi:MAG: ATPase domain-containing protein [Ignavibacteriota bacterium]
MADDSLVRTGIPRSRCVALWGNSPDKRGAGGRAESDPARPFSEWSSSIRGITQFDEPGIIVVFETSPAKLIRDAATMGWDLPALQEQKKLQIVFTSPQVIEQELRSADSLLLEMAIEIGAKRIFIDGIGLLRQASNNNAPMPFSGPGSYRDLLQQLIEGLDREHLTAMLSHEAGNYREAQLTMESAGFLVDTVIRLKRSLQNRRIHRTLEIVKEPRPEL